jgi:hypothetical protein
MQGRFIHRDAVMGTDTGATGVIDANSDTMVVSVDDLSNISVYLNQLVDSGTVSLLVEKTVDGTNWATVATKTQADFPAGANKSIELTLSDGNGMPLRAKAIRVTASGYGATGTYTMTVAGSLVQGF